MPAPEIPAKKANKKNSLFFVMKYKIIAADEKSHKCSGSPSLHSFNPYPSLKKSMPWFIRIKEIIDMTNTFFDKSLFVAKNFGR